MILAENSVLSPGATLLNRGRLKNGNPSGDFLAAPRCGAKTRAGDCACRQPAMANGRCRFHGGKSTGARTAAGRARCARARRTHGFYSAQTVALRREAQTLLRRNRDLLAALRGRPAGHGVLRSKSPAAPTRPLEETKPPMNADMPVRPLIPKPPRSIGVHRRSSAVPNPSLAANPNPASRRPLPPDMGCFARFCVLPPAGLGYSPARAPESRPHRSRPCPPHPTSPPACSSSCAS